MASTDGLALILRFKRLQAEYFARGLAAHEAGAFTLDGGQLVVVERIHAQVAAQAAEAARLLGAAAPAAPDPATYDFTGGGSTGSAPFAGALGATGEAPFEGAVRTEFFKLAQLFGDFSSRLAIGQLGELASDPLAVTYGGRLVVTSGRHAAELRLMRTGANRGPAVATTTAYAQLIAPWPQTVSGRVYDAPGPLGFGGTATDETSQAFVAVLAYGNPATGAAAGTTPTDSEGNQVQFNVGPYSAEAYDEPISTEKALAFLARFVRPVA